MYTSEVQERSGLEMQIGKHQHIVFTTMETDYIIQGVLAELNLGI